MFRHEVVCMLACQSFNKHLQKRSRVWLGTPVDNTVATETTTETTERLCRQVMQVTYHKRLNCQSLCVSYTMNSCPTQESKLKVKASVSLGQQEESHV